MTVLFTFKTEDMPKYLAKVRKAYKDKKLGFHVPLDCMDKEDEYEYEADACKYTYSQGNHCAIGAMLPEDIAQILTDKHGSPSLAGLAGLDCGEVFNTILKIEAVIRQDLIDLQTAHDYCCNLGRRINTEEFEKYYEQPFVDLLTKLEQKYPMHQ